MKTLFFSAAVLACGVQAREPENLAPLFDEMAVLERVLKAAVALERARSGSDLQSFVDRTESNLAFWLQEGVRTLEAEYLARQGILVSVELFREPTAHNVPSTLFTTVARMGETRLPGFLVPLEVADFAPLKELVDELEETRGKHRELSQSLHLELANANANGRSVRPQDSKIVPQMEPVVARERGLKNAIDAEVKRLQGLVQTPPETSTDDIHAALLQAVCDYAMLKSLPDDEHLTLKVSQEKAHLPRRRIEGTYYVLAKQDVSKCRQGAIDAEGLRQRAYVYSRVDVRDHR